jgi:cyclopropane fatty-acyl-phospholipid synthase-like methyltransferase
MAGIAGRRVSSPRSEEELRAIYDQGYVDHYDAHAVARIRRMLPFFELSGREIVADFGCGNGVLLELISPHVHEYVGIDFSEAFIRAAERRRDEHGIQNGTFHCADIVTFCAHHANHFDAAFALDFFEHIYDDQLLRIGQAIRAALKPGALLYLHTPNEEYFMERLRASGVMKQIEGHVAVRDAGRYEALLTQCGFTDVRVRYLAHYLRAAATLHRLGDLPLIGRHFRARLFLTCRKGPPI